MRGGRLWRAAGSLRVRLTAAYVVLVAVLLAALGVGQYFAIRSDLVGSRVDSLRGDLSAGTDLMTRIAATVKDTAEPARAITLRRNICTGVEDHSSTAGAALSVTRLAAPLIRAEALACAVAKLSGRTVSVVIVDRNLDAVATAGGLPSDIPRMDSAALSAALQSGTSAAQRLSTSEGDRLAVAFRITMNGDIPLGAAQLATSTQSIDDVLAGERIQLAVEGSVVLVLAGLAGILLTGRALGPLRRLTETARRLAGGDLRARSNVPPRDDEIGTLAHSFDDMAARIEEAFAERHESEARMRRFIADASHELRTPVTALTGYIDVLRRGAAHEPAALDAALDAMRRESERMRGLVLDLLTLARIDAARPQHVERIALDGVVATVLDEGVPGMPQQVERHLSSGAAVVADRESLVTIARNLLVNACKYAPGARQTWSTFHDGGRAGFRVTDEGPGIAAADLPHVFERFYRGEKTRAREEGGSGLGLSIVQSLARSLGGDAAVESVEGRGTAVTVWLPSAA
ncbi:MAG TPA: HAMP domain-containing sensor histidine kinase [Candidatus Dormibacteraeota bacterium]|nr:HAMP domain-containing sensor histidine kinase [Candidatus Dormibacteraeota bacterium]